MKFSYCLPRPDDISRSDEPQRLVELATAVEAAGVHGVSASDHPFPFVAPGQAGHQALDPFTLLTYIGSATRRLTLQFSLIVAPYRNPFLTARQLATMGMLFPGRVVAGFGSGYLTQEFDALGADFARRGDTLREGMPAMLDAWGGEPVVAVGTGWRAEGNVMRPAVSASTRPTLWRGGNSRTAREHAAEIFDGWAPFEVEAIGAEQTGTARMGVDNVAAAVEHLHRCTEDAGRSGRLDVCFVRPGRRWLSDPASAADQLARLDAGGVTSVEFTVAGTEAAEVSDGVERLVGLAQAAGVWEATSGARV